MKRVGPSLVAVSMLPAVVLGLAACSDAAATMPVVVPSTQMPEASGTAAPSPSTSSGRPTLAPPTTSIAPAVHDAKAVEALVKAAVVDGKVDLQPSPTSTDEAVLAPCPGGAAVKQPVSHTAVTQTWGSLDAAPHRRIVISSVTYRDISTATAAAEPLLKAAAGCATVPAPVGGTATVVQHRREVAEGMPLARIDVRTKQSGKTTFTYLGFVLVGNVMVQLTMNGPDLTVLRSEGGDTLGLLARKIQLA